MKNYQVNCSLSKTTFEYDIAMSSQYHWLNSLPDFNGHMLHFFYPLSAHVEQ
ncbi:hypothetical protein K8B83_19915 [Shewanella inventionis]|uniref:hypothetical protein n=1 Tax=Shewanella inventionis TaxID=1738770 RepID=UPI0016634CF9|nr:hypothetical protein [Shewanella inventionis]MCL1158991.1 hypothetical protein [Shewanella inventionis]UAL43041.1 hypothetical protein K8B83_19915 [Shewanella inventionis]